MPTRKESTKQSSDAARKRQTIQPVGQDLVLLQEHILPLTQSVQRAIWDPGHASPSDILALQHAAGNRTVSHFIQTKLTVGPVGDRYEQEADRVAEQVMTMPLPSPARGGAGGELQRQGEEPPRELQAKPLAATITPLLQCQEEDQDLQIRPVAAQQGLQRQEEEEQLQMRPATLQQVLQRQAVGSLKAGEALEHSLAAQKGGGSPLPDDTRDFMEPRFGADFSGVRVHTGGEAEQMTQALKAQAFTHGQDIYVGAGRYNPGTDAGKRLLAHELTHTLQQGGGTRVPQTASIGALVQAKLLGSYQALTAVGTKGRTWNKIRGKVREYEALEQGQVSSIATAARLKEQSQAFKQAYPGRARSLGTQAGFEQRAITGRFDTMRSALQDLIARMNAWLATYKRKNKEYTINRLSALRMLLPRVKLELRDIDSGRFAQTAASGRLTVIKYNAVGGAMNKLDHVSVDGVEGYFSEEKAFQEPGAQPAEVGKVKGRDPRLGARSVAMYRLDQLLGTNVLVKTEFAVSGREDPATRQITQKMGFFMAKAGGVEAGKAATQGVDISAEDPTLQRSMNKLQLLDVICGQLDRHMGNYYVQVVNGRVVGVQGIDNDMSFGTGVTGLEVGAQGIHYKGVPPLVDADTAQRILAIKDDEVRALLQDLLSDEEVANTISRLGMLRTELKKMEDQGLWVREAGTVHRQPRQPRGPGGRLARGFLAGHRPTATWGQAQVTEKLRSGKETYFQVFVETAEVGRIKKALRAGGLDRAVLPLAQQNYDQGFMQLADLEPTPPDMQDKSQAEILEYKRKKLQKDIPGLKTTLAEYVDGLLDAPAQTLQKRVQGGQVTMEQALAIARDMGTGMELPAQAFNFAGASGEYIDHEIEWL